METWVKDQLSNVKRDRNSVGVLDTLTGARVPAANKSIMGKIFVSGLGRTVIFECLPCECTGRATCRVPKRVLILSDPLKGSSPRTGPSVYNRDRNNGKFRSETFRTHGLVTVALGCLDFKGEVYGPTISQCASASIQAPSQWSRESGQREHLSDLSSINDPTRADEPFSDVASPLEIWISLE